MICKYTILKRKKKAKLYFLLLVRNEHDTNKEFKTLINHAESINFSC